MRNFVSKFSSLAMAGVGMVLLSAVAAQAQAQTLANVTGLTCDGYARTVADTANRDIMERAGALDTNRPGKVLVIAAGRKFYISSQQLDAETLAPISVWERMNAWNEAYGDAYHHCRHANNITFEVKK